MRLTPLTIALLAFFALSSSAEQPPAALPHTIQAIAGLVSDRAINWGGVAATGVLVIVPLVALGLLVQRNLIKGLTMGAMKG